MRKSILTRCLLLSALNFNIQVAVATPFAPFGRAIANAIRAILPPANEIKINSASTSGSGCPRRAVSVDISLDRTAVTLGFDEFQTFIGRRFGSSERDKNCEIRLNVFYPGGYTFAVLEATYHGFAQLDAGVTGSFETSYSFPGSRMPRNGRTESNTRASITGGGQLVTGGTYTKKDSIPTESRVLAPCGQNATMLIKTRINLSSSNASAEGTLTGDDATFAFTHQMHIEWTRLSGWASLPNSHQHWTETARDLGSYSTPKHQRGYGYGFATRRTLKRRNQDKKPLPNGGQTQNSELGGKICCVS